MTSAPRWVRAVAWSLRRLPRGRYAVISTIRRGTAPFIASLPPAQGGARFECDLGDDISREVCFSGSYEPPVTRVFQGRLRRGATVVDAGANWGYFSLIAAALVGPSGRVIALEPDPRHFSQLTRNRDLNGFVHMEPINAAASLRSGRATLIGYGDGVRNRGVSRLASDDAAGGIAVPCVSVDALTGSRDVDLIKIDVEGAEADVLVGMREGLAARRYRAVLLELHPALLTARGTSVEGCTRMLSDAGYQGWTIDVSTNAYRRALSPRIPTSALLSPDVAQSVSPWPHQLWLAPGERVG